MHIINMFQLLENKIFYCSFFGSSPSIHSLYRLIIGITLEKVFYFGRENENFLQPNPSINLFSYNAIDHIENQKDFSFLRIV